MRSEDTTKSVQVHRLRVGAGDAGKRIDRFLAEHVPELSRRRARFLLDAGSVWVDGRRIRVQSRPLKPGQEILCHVQSLGTGPRQSLPGSRILHEDDHLVAIDKPAAVPSHPTRARQLGTAIQLLEEHLWRRDGRKIPLWPLHRLDAGTSGLLLFAKRRDAARHVNETFAARRVVKRYTALVAGAMEPQERVVTDRLVELHLRSEPDETGKEAETRITVLRRLSGASLVEAEPRTGRMHQIRVHLAAVGHPVVGDERYGNDVSRALAVRLGADRMFLHASALELPHPVKDRLLRLEAPVPEEFRSAIRVLGE